MRSHLSSWTSMSSLIANASASALLALTLSCIPSHAFLSQLRSKPFSPTRWQSNPLSTLDGGRVALMSNLGRTGKLWQQQSTVRFPLAASTIPTSLSMTSNHTVAVPEARDVTPLNHLVSSSATMIDGNVTQLHSHATLAQSPSVSLTQQDSSSNTNKNNLRLKQRVSFPVVLWRFTRPHTLIGSALAIPSLHLLAATSWSQAFSLPTLFSILVCMVPSLLMNLYITGLNQITDVEIDKINKPNLPIAAGILTRRTATGVVALALIVSLVLGHLSPTGVYSWMGRYFSSSPGLRFCLWGSAILGTMYSLPPIRLKRFPALAAFCIVAVRGTVINAGFFAHAKASMAAAAAKAAGTTRATSSIWSYLCHDHKCLYSSLYFAVFGMVIAFMKDVPDVIGDKVSDIRTLSVRIGPRRVFYFSQKMLSTLFAGAGLTLLFQSFQALTATTKMFTTYTAFATATTPLLSRFAAPSPLVVGRAIAGIAALAASRSVTKRAQSVNPDDSQQVYSFYMHLWKLFYLSYLILPLAR